MSNNRIIHLIQNECDVFVERIGTNAVRIRVTEKDPELSDPADFEIEGNATHIAEAFYSAASVLDNLEEFFAQEPS